MHLPKTFGRKLDEFGIIAQYFAPLAKHYKGAFSLTDDAAVVDAKSGYQLVFSKDMITENTHFTFEKDAVTGAQMSPSQLAQKLLRTNLSDMAAMGAVPKYYLLGAAIDKSVDEKWVASFASGLAKDQKKFGITLIGGDTVKKSESGITLSLTIIGEAKRGRVVKRSGAKVGDKIYVSGTIGDAAFGLKALRGQIKNLSPAAHRFVVNRYHIPEPRVAFGRALATQSLVHSMIDISDGLLADLGHIAETSKVGMKIYRDHIPLSSAASAIVKSSPSAWKTILAGGDDYELAFTASSKHHHHIMQAAKQAKVRVTHIGDVARGNEVVLLDKNEEKIAIDARGFTHFGW